MTGIDDSVVNVRYAVDELQVAVDFYTTHLGFTLRTAHLPAFADVTRGNLGCWPDGPAPRASRCPTGSDRSRVAGTGST